MGWTARQEIPNKSDSPELLSKELGGDMVPYARTQP